MKIKVRVAYSVSHVTTVTVTLTADGITIARARRVASSKLASEILALKAEAVEQLASVQAALA